MNLKKIVPLSIGCLALATTLVGWKPARTLLVDTIVGSETMSLPGDSATAAFKVPFHYGEDLNMPAGFSSNIKVVSLPDTSEARIETVTISCNMPAGQAPRLRLLTKVGGTTVAHNFEMQSCGTFTSGGVLYVRYVGTNEVRILAQSGNSIPPTTSFDVSAGRNGPTTQAITFSVSISGYRTPGPNLG